MMNIPAGEPISLTSRTPYLDDDHARYNSCISDSDPLLEGDLGRLNAASHHKSKWASFLSFNNADTGSASRCEDQDVEQSMFGRRRRSRLLLRVGLGTLVVLGVVQLLNLIVTLLVFILPGGVHDIVESWGKPGQIGANLASWPTDFSRDILPIPCHSHNDYWRLVPLYSAIEAGCIGVEADIWLFEDELFVGHSIPSLTRNRTLNSLYINPLLDILSKQNPKHTLMAEGNSRLHGVFDTDPEQQLIFLIDFKTAGESLWPQVQAALQPLRAFNYLTRSNGSEIIPGPIIVVGTGNAPFDLVTSGTHNPHHDIFFDAPLADMYLAPDAGSPPIGTATIEDLATDNALNYTPPDGYVTNVATEKDSRKRSDKQGQGKFGTNVGDVNAYNISNSYYASVAFGSTIGHMWDGELSEYQLSKIRGQIRGAHKRGLKARYWDLPFWPINLRNYVWDILVKEGIDLLNVDDLKGATRRNWDKHQGWWKPVKGTSYGVRAGGEIPV